MSRDTNAGGRAARARYTTLRAHTCGVEAPRTASAARSRRLSVFYGSSGRRRSMFSACARWRRVPPPPLCHLPAAAYRLMPPLAARVLARLRFAQYAAVAADGRSRGHAAICRLLSLTLARRLPPFTAAVAAAACRLPPPPRRRSTHQQQARSRNSPHAPAFMPFTVGDARHSLARLQKARRLIHLESGTAPMTIVCMRSRHGGASNSPLFLRALE